MAAAQPEQVFEVFADVWCPFAHFGLRALADHLRLRGAEEARIWVRAWPLEWINGRPMDPAAVREHADELCQQVTPGLFVGFDGSTFPRTTIPALALAASAYRSSMRLGQAVSYELRDALFERGENVADPDTLARVAESFDVGAPDPDDYAAVVADWKEGRAREVVGSPHFFCGGLGGAFCPSLDVAASPTGQGKAITPNLERLGAFLDDCLASAAP